MIFLQLCDISLVWRATRIRSAIEQSHYPGFSTVSYISQVSNYFYNKSENCRTSALSSFIMYRSYFIKFVMWRWPLANFIFILRRRLPPIRSYVFLPLILLPWIALATCKDHKVNHFSTLIFAVVHVCFYLWADHFPEADVLYEYVLHRQLCPRDCMDYGQNFGIQIMTWEFINQKYFFICRSYLYCRLLPFGLGFSYILLFPFPVTVPFQVLQWPILFFFLAVIHLRRPLNDRCHMGIHYIIPTMSLHGLYIVALVAFTGAIHHIEFRFHELKDLWRGILVSTTSVGTSSVLI